MGSGASSLVYGWQAALRCQNEFHGLRIESRTALALGIHADEPHLLRLSPTPHRFSHESAGQAAAAEARAALAALLAAADARRRCDFLEAVVSGMHASLRFFERGHEVSRASGLCAHACEPVCVPGGSLEAPGMQWPGCETAPGGAPALL